MKIPSNHEISNARLDSSGLIYSLGAGQRSRILNEFYHFLLEHERILLLDNGLLKSVSDNYKSKWPVFKVNWWSRPYEYLFVISNISKYYSRGARTYYELGPGCSIVPYILASMYEDIRIVLCDNDQDALEFQKSVFSHIGFNNYTLESSLCLDSLASADVFYSISVLEHCPRPVSLMADIVSSMNPGSVFITTLDVDLIGSSHGISMRDYTDLVANGINGGVLLDIASEDRSSLLTNAKSWYFFDDKDLQSCISMKSSLFSRIKNRLVQFWSPPPSLAVAKLVIEVG